MHRTKKNYPHTSRPNFVVHFSTKYHIFQRKHWSLTMHTALQHLCVPKIKHLQRYNLSIDSNEVKSLNRISEYGIAWCVHFQMIYTTHNALVHCIVHGIRCRSGANVYQWLRYLEVWMHSENCVTLTDVSIISVLNCMRVHWCFLFDIEQMKWFTHSVCHAQMRVFPCLCLCIWNDVSTQTPENINNEFRNRINF